MNFLAAGIYMIGLSPRLRGTLWLYRADFNIYSKQTKIYRKNQPYRFDKRIDQTRPPLETQS